MNAFASLVVPELEVSRDGWSGPLTALGAFSRVTRFEILNSNIMLSVEVIDLASAEHRKCIHINLQTDSERVMKAYEARQLRLRATVEGFDSYFEPSVSGNWLYITTSIGGLPENFVKLTDLLRIHTLIVTPRCNLATIEALKFLPSFSSIVHVRGPDPERNEAARKILGLLPKCPHDPLVQSKD
jgi:hypothetical protein